jgi:hypothetical protein
LIFNPFGRQNSLESLTLLFALGLAYACSCVSLAEAANVECHSNKQFFIAAKPFDDEPGSLFAVTALAHKPAPKTCSFDADHADFVLGQKGDPLWYGDQAGKYLILQRSTGPQGDLVIYDLATRKLVLDVPADDFSVEAGSVAFWERTEAATAGNCPNFAENQANGLSSVISKRRLFDPASAKISDTKDERCDAVQ